MDKLKLHTPNLTAANIEKIAALFPNCVTEAKDEKGQLKRAIDFDLLRQELSDHIVEGPRERYHLEWPGKRAALLAANAPIAKSLRPVYDESVDFEKTKNLFIEGDNLDALKLLQETYLGKVKMIYIDPPYNTGGDFIYRDTFEVSTSDYFLKSLQRDDSGSKLVLNSESNGRYHSEWASMLFPRLRLARNLLADHGVIFVSIGQEEVASVVSLCEELFGRRNFVTICSRVMKRGGQKGTHFSPCVDYIVVFAKNIDELSPFREELSQNVITEVYTKVETTGSRKGEKYRSMGLYQAGLEQRANQRYYIECPDGALVIPPGVTFPSDRSEGSQCEPNDGDGVWRWTYARFVEEKNAGNIEFLESDRSSLVQSDGTAAKWNIYYKIWLNDRLEDGQLPGNIIEKFENRHSSAELKELDIPFDFAKPSALIKFLMAISCVKPGEIVLDFFAGSGSTAQAALELGAETGACYPFICVQLPEQTKADSDEARKGFKTIADVCKERIRRVAKRLKDEHATSVDNLDLGFRVLKTDTSNMKDVYYATDTANQANLSLQTDNIKEDRSPEDLLFQVLVDWGVDLTLPIEKQTVVGHTVFFVDGNALAACFDAGVSESLVKELAKRRPLRAVFRDASFASDSVKINVEQIFKLLSPDTEVKSL